LGFAFVYWKLRLIFHQGDNVLMQSGSVQDPSLIFGLELDGSGGADSISAATDNKSCWLHFDYSYPSAEKCLSNLGLPDNVVAALVRPETRPRTWFFKEGVLVFVRGVNSNPGSDPEDMVSLRMWIEPDRLITVRQRRLYSVQDIKQEFEKGTGPDSIPQLIVRLIERLADRVTDFVEDIEERLSSIEDELERNIESGLRPQISSIRRQTAAVRRFMAPQREALDALFRQSIDLLGPECTAEIQEQADRFIRGVEDLDLIRERATVLQEELLNLIVQEQSDRMYALSIVAAIFLPITFVSGVFGMNVAGLPGTEDANSFWIVSTLMLTVSVGVIIWLKIKRWL
jgi:zinc transporter